MLFLITQGKRTLYNLICETDWNARIARNTVTLNIYQERVTVPGYGYIDIVDTPGIDSTKD